MEITKVSPTQRDSVTQLNLDRDALMYPLSLASQSIAAPPVPAGMTHDQAVAAPGDYQTAYEEYQLKMTGITNAAVVGWAMDVNNIANFADTPPKPNVLANEIADQEKLFETYVGEFTGWVENPIINRGLKLIAIATGLRRITSKPFDEIARFVDAAYRRWGVIDEKLVSDAIKSESGDSGGGAGVGGGPQNPAGVEDAPVRAE